MSSRRSVLVLLLVSFVNGWGSARAECDSPTVLATQVDTLLAEYDREVAPRARLSVRVALDVRHAALRHSDIRVLADFKLSWVDARVVWNASQWGCNSTLVSSERVWVPDVRPLNAAVGPQGESGLRARLSSEGMISWVTRMELIKPIGLQMEQWPRDEQTADFKFASRLLSSDELQLEVDNLQHSVVFEADAWEIMSVSGAVSTVAVGGQDAEVVSWVVRVRRRAHAHAVAASATLAATVLVLGGAALLPPASRAPLAATATLLATLWLVSSVPHVSLGGGAPRALRVFCALCAAGGAAVVCAALSAAVATVRAPPPPPLKAFLSFISTFCTLTPHTEEQESGSAWSAAATLLERVQLVALLVTLLVLVCVYAF